MSRWISWTLVLLCGLFPPRVAVSAERLVWQEEAIHVELVPPVGSDIQMRQSFLRAAERAAAAWETDCGAPRLRISLAKSRVHGAVRDGRNTIVFLQRWCRNSRKDDQCYDHRKVAMTTVYRTKKARAPRIVEADVEINAVDYPYTRDGELPVSLEAVLVHELGHVLGLRDGSPSQATGAMVTEAGRHTDGPTTAEITELCNLYDSGDTERTAPLDVKEPRGWTGLAALALASAGSVAFVAAWRQRAKRKAAR